MSFLIPVHIGYFNFVHQFLLLRYHLTSHCQGQPLQGEGYIYLISAVNQYQLQPTPGTETGVNFFKVCKDVGMGIIHCRSLAGRAECTTFPTLDKAIMVLSALLKGTTVMTGIWTHILHCRQHQSLGPITRAWVRLTRPLGHDTPRPKKVPEITLE